MTCGEFVLGWLLLVLALESWRQHRVKQAVKVKHDPEETIPF